MVSSVNSTSCLLLTCKVGCLMCVPCVCMCVPCVGQTWEIVRPITRPLFLKLPSTQDSQVRGSTGVI